MCKSIIATLDLIPENITSDRGPQFVSELWRDLNALLGVKVMRTFAYHPQAHGLVERFHRQLKDSLRARCRTAQWTVELPFVLLGIRSAWREDQDCSPAELVYGTTLRLPSDMIRHSNAPHKHSSIYFLVDLRKAMQNTSFPTEFHGYDNQRMN